MAEDEQTPLEDKAATPAAETDPSGDAEATEVKASRSKQHRIRKPWVTIYATESERTLVALQAERAGLSASAYLLQRGLQSQVVVRTDWQEAVTRLGHVHAELSRVAELVAGSATPIDAVGIILQLARIEEAARGIVTSPQRAFARLIDGIDWSVSDPATSTPVEGLQNATTAAPVDTRPPAEPEPHTARHASQPSLESDAGSPPEASPC